MKDVNFDNRKILIFISVFVLTVTLLCIGFSYYFKEVNNQREQIRLENDRLLNEQIEKEINLKNAIVNLDDIFDEENRPREEITNEDLIAIRNDIDLVDDETAKKELISKLEEVENYINVGEKIDNIFIDNILVMPYSVSDINAIKEDISLIKEEWQQPYLDKMQMIDNQIAIIDTADKKVKALFSDKKLTKVKDNVTRKKYNDAQKSVSKIVQVDIKKKYNANLDAVLKVVEEKEEEARRIAEEKARKEAEIKAAWVILDTPYISQNKNKIYNGCEAASLLMALQYKGQLTNTSLKTMVDNMPKSEDDPHEGFVRDIYGFEPRDVPHWIAPDALAKFGKQYYSKVSDITGTSVQGLKKEIDKGNPVVIYATGGVFADPVNWVEEVPKNVHVMLLIGYNPISKQMVINDPWTKTSDGKVYISESRFTYIYNLIGKKAVVVR